MRKWMGDICGARIVQESFMALVKGTLPGMEESADGALRVEPPAKLPERLRAAMAAMRDLSLMRAAPRLDCSSILIVV